MTVFVGEIRIFAFDFVPKNFKLCDGSRLDKNVFSTLYRVIGDAFTNDPSSPNTFSLPDLRDRFVIQDDEESKIGQHTGKAEIVLSMNQMPEHNHQTKLKIDHSDGGEDKRIRPNNAYLNNNFHNFSPTTPATNTLTKLGSPYQEKVGNAKPIDIRNRQLKMVYAICADGAFPSSSESLVGSIGEIRIWPTKRILPKSWRVCDGTTLRDSDNPALYSEIGTFFGGSIARHEFKLPDFTNRAPKGAVNTDKVGKTGGKTKFRLEKNHLPPHTHHVKLPVNDNTNSEPHSQIPTGAYLNGNTNRNYSGELSNQNNSLGGISEQNRGGNEEIDILNPSIGLVYIICTEGIYHNLDNDLCYTGEIKMNSGYKSLEVPNFIRCYGQILQINQNQSLYSLLGFKYGRVNNVSFGVPDLRDKTPVCCTQMSEVGNEVGADSIRLEPDHLPAHNHEVTLGADNTGSGTVVQIPGALLTKDAGPFSLETSPNAFLAGMQEEHFAGEAVDIRNPYLTINYLICTNGVFPERT